MATVDERKQRIRDTRNYRQLHAAMKRAEEKYPVERFQRRNFQTVEGLMLLFVIFVVLLSCLIAPVLAEMLKTFPAW